MKNEKILIHQPELSPYRTPIFNQIAKKINIILSLDSNGRASGTSGKQKLDKKIKKILVKKINFIYINFRINFFNILKENYLKAVILPSDIKNITWYITIYLCKKNKIPCFIWGHGVYKKNLNNIFIFLFYKTIFKFYEHFIVKYICYNNLVKNSLMKIGYNPKKLIVINNTLEKNRNFKNNFKKRYDKNEILFVGRLRDKNNLELLFNALSILKKNKTNLKLNVVGSGIFLKKLKEICKKDKIDVIFHGENYNSQKIKKIADNCFVGVYPGNSGLSIVDFFYYGLPVIVHDDFKSHMGPEPYYVKNNYNGLLFKKLSAISLSKKIYTIYKNKKLIKKLSKGSYETFSHLNKKKISTRLEELIL